MNLSANPDSGESDQAVIDRCLAEFDALYEAGQNPKAAQFRSRFQGDDQADFVELIYHEFCRLEADGRSPDQNQFLVDYESFQKDLEKLFAIHFGLEFNTPQLDQLEAESLITERMPTIGDEIGQFRLIKILGQGGGGRVFLAIQMDLADRKVVLKITRSGSTREPELLARVIHPNVMSVYRHFVTADNGFHVTVMPYIPGASLDQLLKADLPGQMPKRKSPNRLSQIRLVDVRPKLAKIAEENANNRDFDHDNDLKTESDHEKRSKRSWPEQVKQWSADLADALHTAFQQGVIHGDIKPGNVYIGVNQVPYLLDFHLSRIWQFENHRRVSLSEDQGGTLYYMPPERLRQFAASVKKLNTNQKPISVKDQHRGDLYSLGLVILEMLTGYDPTASGNFPHEDHAQQALLIAENREHRHWLSDWPGFRRLPKPWREILTKLLSSDIANRFEDGSKLAGELRKLPDPSTVSRVFAHGKAAERKRPLIALVSLTILCYAGWVVHSLRSDFAKQVLALWSQPNFLSEDVAMTHEQSLAFRIRSARLQLEQSRMNQAEIWQRSTWKNFILPRASRLDSEIWLLDRMNELAEALKKRALITKNQSDLQSAAGIMQQGLDLWGFDGWQEGLKTIESLSKIKQKSARPETGHKPGREDANATLLKSYFETLHADATAANVRLWWNLIERAPDSFGLRWGFVRYLVRLDEKEQAILQLKRIKEIAPEHFESRRLLAFLEYQLGQFDSALNEIEAAIELRPDDISSLRIRAILRIYHGQLDEVMAEVTRLGELIDFDQRGDDFLNQATVEIQKLVDPESAEPILKQSSEIFDLKTIQTIAKILPDDLQIMYLLMYKYYKYEKPEDALVIMEKIVKKNPGSIKDKMNLAAFYRLEGQVEKSVKIGMESLSNPNLPALIRYHNIIVNHFISLIRTISEKDIQQATLICDRLIQNCEVAGVGLGRCYYEKARLILEAKKDKGLKEALIYLFKSGQQNLEYLTKWYLKDSVFYDYRIHLDPELRKVFPEMDLNQTMVNEKSR